MLVMELAVAGPHDVAGFARARIACRDSMVNDAVETVVELMAEAVQGAKHSIVEAALAKCPDIFETEDFREALIAVLGGWKFSVSADE